MLSCCTMMMTCDTADYEFALKCSGTRSGPLLLPRMEGDLEEDGDCSRFAPETQEAPASRLAVPRVAVVDDEEDLHAFLKELQELGHFRLAGSFYTAATALERLPEERPDAV